MKNEAGFLSLNSLSSIVVGKKKILSLLIQSYLIYTLYTNTNVCISPVSKDLLGQALSTGSKRNLTSVQQLNWKAELEFRLA